ncbi:hypothetical protein M3I54_32310 [Paraburkholderia sp. CNPSo 3274]|uniref:hypothetical protein n=1 Tax=Paraburkholderia sp. CNPSo 3274 TaxID=2940932 RepID=UPI0020B75B85|nr:hypothetical protein [Paraburkholderia sp. CNPSo 3274]MCP3711583.1 hypothetical protein [Paraburkholderia sp. CNPSo 3274]
MSHRARLRRHASEAVLLSHMELARAQLLAANVGSRLVERASARTNSLSVANVGRALIAAPNVTLLGSLLLGTLLIGPRRVVPVVLRTGLTGWIARNVRILFAR